MFPLRYANGEIRLPVTDIQAGGFGLSWGHTRTFANQMTADYDGPNGYNWFVRGLSYLLEFDDDTIVVMGDANDVLWFDLLDGLYVARFDVKDRLLHDPVDQVFRLQQTEGSVVEFHDFDQTAYSQGLFKRQIDAAGNSIEVTSYDSGEIGEVQRQATVNGVTTTESFLYQYEWYGRLSRVVLRRKVAGGSWRDVQKVEYTYYTRYDGAHGLEGDLKLAETFAWDEHESQWQPTGTTYYRYYDELASGSGSGSGSGGEGNAHLLKFVVNPASYERLAADPDVSDPLTASDAQVAMYADHYFQYDGEW